MHLISCVAIACPVLCTNCYRKKNKQTKTLHPDNYDHTTSLHSVRLWGECRSKQCKAPLGKKKRKNKPNMSVCSMFALFLKSSSSLTVLLFLLCSVIPRTESLGTSHHQFPPSSRSYSQVRFLGGARPYVLKPLSHGYLAQFQSFRSQLPVLYFNAYCIWRESLRALLVTPYHSVPPSSGDFTSLGGPISQPQVPASNGHLTQPESFVSHLPAPPSNIAHDLLKVPGGVPMSYLPRPSSNGCYSLFQADTPISAAPGPSSKAPGGLTNHLPCSSSNGYYSLFQADPPTSSNGCYSLFQADNPTSTAPGPSSKAPGGLTNHLPRPSSNGYYSLFQADPPTATAPGPSSKAPGGLTNHLHTPMSTAPGPSYNPPGGLTNHLPRPSSNGYYSLFQADPPMATAPGPSYKAPGGLTNHLPHPSSNGCYSHFQADTPTATAPGRSSKAPGVLTNHLPCPSSNGYYSLFQADIPTSTAQSPSSKAPGGLTNHLPHPSSTGCYSLFQADPPTSSNGYQITHPKSFGGPMSYVQGPPSNGYHIIRTKSHGGPSHLPGPPCRENSTCSMARRPATSCPDAQIHR